MAETPKKVMGNNCFLCSSHLISSGRVCVFGKSSVCISGVIKEAMEIDVSLFSSSDPFVCSNCYKYLTRFQKIKKNLQSVEKEIKRRLQERGIQNVMSLPRFCWIRLFDCCINRKYSCAIECCKIIEVLKFSYHLYFSWKKMVKGHLKEVLVIPVKGKVSFQSCRKFLKLHQMVCLPRRLLLHFSWRPRQWEPTRAYIHLYKWSHTEVQQ